MWYLYRPSIFVAGWWSSLMSLSGPEQSVSFDLFLNFGKAGKELRMWCNRWRLPDRVHSGLMYWMQHQLLLHHRALQSDCHESHREVTHDLRVMQGLVFTPADHFPHSLHVACPFAFHVLLDTTFLDATVFQRCTVGMSSILANLKSRFQSVPKWSRR